MNGKTSKLSPIKLRKKSTPTKGVSKEIDHLDERVTAIEIQNADRFSHIMATMDNIKNDISQILTENRDHLSQHHKTEMTVTDLKRRMSTAEGRITNISNKLWSAITAIFGIIGTAVAALLKWPQS
jgi:chromosome segregation ATPase